MDDKNKESELIDASSSPLFQLANETKEEEQQINNDFIAKKEKETVITNSEVNQMFNKGTVATSNTNSNESGFSNEEVQPMFNNDEAQNSFDSVSLEQTSLNQSISNIPENSPTEPTMEPPKKNNNEPNPMPGIILLIVLFLAIGGIAYYNVFLKDSGDNKQSSNNVARENNKEEDESKKEDTKKEEPKKDEPVKEVTTTLNCSGKYKDYGITISATSTIVFKNNELYTVKVVEKSNSFTRETLDLAIKSAYASGYSYSASNDFKSITMTGTKNTLNRSVKEKIGTLELAKSYYTSLGLSCRVN